MSCLCGDARRMDAVADDSVALVVTSPPYFAGKQYEEELDREGVPGSYIEYLALLRDVFAECKRVLEPGGRIAVNVANLGRKPYRSLAADVMTILQDDLHLLPRGEIVWQKGEGASGSCAWGSFRSAANPVLRDVTERVIVASKGRFGRARSPKERRRDGLPHESSVGADDFMALTLDVWDIPPESARAGAASRPVPRRAAPAPDGALHVPRRPGGRPVRRVGLDAGGRGPLRARRRRLRPRPGLRRAGPGPAGRRGAARTRGHRGRDAGADGTSATTLGAGRPRGGRLRRRAAQPAPARARHGRRLHGHRRRRGRTWYFDVAGPNSAYRGGMVRSETVWRTLGRAHVMAARGVAPFVVLTTQLPRSGTEADRALRAPGPGGIFDAVDLLSPDGRARLAAYAAGRCRLARWPGSGPTRTWRRAPSEPGGLSMGTVVACAVVRDDPPRVFVAEDLDTLNWVLACQLVATTPGRDLPPGERAALRQALREAALGRRRLRLHRPHRRRGGRLREHGAASRADAAVGPLELQLTPLFTE